MGSLIAIKYDREAGLSLLDQRQLPFETTWLATPTPQDAWQQIKDMVVRGAPAIGVTGALALAQHITRGGGGSQYATIDAAIADVDATMDYLVTSRPTAVNLADSAAKLKAAARRAAAAPGATPAAVASEVVAVAEATLEEDIAANKAIGAAGAKALLAAVAARGKMRPGGKVRVLTHCNTGSLATAAYGTALGVLRALHEGGALEHAYCTETRPYNQGARLTAFELVHDGLPSTLICDSAAAALMGAGAVDAVFVGADRVVANGDTANKIGTYALGIAAAHHGLPFFVAAPTTTLDAALPDGGAIEIEQRPAEEITHFRGARVAAEGIGIWNPCFDVVPGTLVEGIVTEKGLVPRDSAGGGHAVRAFMAALGLWAPPEGGGGEAEAAAAAAPGGGEGGAAVGAALGADGVRSYVAGRPELAAAVGPPGSEGSWSVDVRSDGNINFVYLLTGPAGGLCVKESLPYVRCVGESWPLSRDRCRIEAEGLRLQARLAPRAVPAVLHFDGGRSLIAMEFIAPPAAILRRGIIAGSTYPALAGHVSAFLAATLFGTSLLALDARAFRENVIKFSNPDLCALTEQVVFTDPYYAAPFNTYSPGLGPDAAALRGDAAAKAAAAGLKALFMTRAEALVHGDLHTGSIMVTPTSSVMIDPEFMFAGPMAFDIAKIVGELLIPYFASDGLGGQGEGGVADRAPQRAWLLGCIIDIWEGFSASFLEMWDDAAAGRRPAGDLVPRDVVGPSAPAGAEALSAQQGAFMRGLFREVVGLAGAVIIRRLVGIAHTADMDSISDAAARAACERRALRFGRHLLVEGPAAHAGIRSVADAAAAARAADGLPA
ncbi:MAG: hypothetical protein J3K34DRAFT_189039 [Monoraphidium minutum]|nr:MAG: hypothetical protein J3K34DRAFT_189039 [Monoraphidium minutum]